jgi:hypothetical protein
MRFKEMEESTFSVTNISGYEVVTEYRSNGTVSRIGTKLDSSRLITEAWRKRLGTYECVEAGEAPVLFYIKGITLKEYRGFLFAAIETSSVACEAGQKWPATFLVLSDSEAIINGVHRGNKGDTLRAFVINGQEYLRFYGYTFKRIQ